MTIVDMYNIHINNSPTTIVNNSFQRPIDILCRSDVGNHVTGIYL
jgi:hypothetical protein